MRFFAQRHTGRCLTFLAALLATSLVACTADPELQADEQSALSARDKLASDEQAGNLTAIGDDKHALFLAYQKLLQDRGEMTQAEKLVEGGGHGGGHGGGMGGGHM